MMKVFLFGLVLFSTLGISVAREILLPFRLDSDLLAVGTGSLLLTCLLVQLLRNGKCLFAMVILLAVSINLPAQILLRHGMDKELLIGALLAIMIFPFIHQMQPD